MAEPVRPPVDPSRPGEWAPPTATFELPPGHRPVDRLTIAGKRPTGANAGFGQLWEKVFELDAGTRYSPEELQAFWRDHFNETWPGQNHFEAFRGIRPGEIAALDLAAGPVAVSTGVMVLRADARSFTMVTPQGHPFAGWITVACEPGPVGTVARITVVVRASDPLYELGLILGGHAGEEKFWMDTLRNLAKLIGVEAEPRKSRRLVDGDRQWSRAGNIVHNAAIRSVPYNALVLISRSVRWLSGKGRRSS